MERCNKVAAQDGEVTLCNNNILHLTLATGLAMMTLTMMVPTSLLRDRLDMLILLDEVKLPRRVVTQAKEPISTRIEINSEVGEEVTGAEVEEIVDVVGAATRINEVEVMDSPFHLNRNNIRLRPQAQGRSRHHSNLK